MKLRETSKFKHIINSFLKIKLFNNNRLTIGAIRDKTIFELLKDFVRQSAQEEESKDRKSEAYHTNLEEQPSPMTTLEREARRQAEEFFNHATRIADKHRMDRNKLLYCLMHGLNSSHTTADCRELQSVGRVNSSKYSNQHRDSSKFSRPSSTRIGNYRPRDYRTENPGRDPYRSQSRSRSRSRDRNFRDHNSDRNHKSPSRSPYR